MQARGAAEKSSVDTGGEVTGVKVCLQVGRSTARGALR